jgi:4-amino-4-deoxy-L-arabinose transferase-like glycosyltransferase
MLNFPFYEGDEGIYLSQAWAVAKLGRLAPYTYTYDHAPLGWIQLAAWSILTGGFSTFGTAIDSGRVLMLVIQLGSTYLLYRIARGVSDSVLVATVAALAFALSPYGLYYHRRVLLDNLSTFWILLSIALLVGARLSGRRLGLSALALGASVLSKEVTAFVVPALALLVFVRSEQPRRWSKALGWAALVGAVCSAYPLLALAQGQLLPANGSPGVSLVEALQWQASRGRDGGLLAPGSRFWTMAASWARSDPLLVGVGSLATLASLAAIGRRPVVCALGLATLLLWLFLARGGEIFAFYLVPALPLLALNVGLLVGSAARGLERRLGSGGPLGRLLPPAAVALCLGLAATGYSSPDLAYQNSPLTPWVSRPAVAQKEAIEWVKQNVLPESRLVTDYSLWTDLQAAPNRSGGYRYAHPYWKVELDSNVRVGVFRNDWRTVDYLITSPQLLQDSRNAGMSLVAAAWQHSRPVASFDTGGWPIEIRRVDQLGG